MKSTGALTVRRRMPSSWIPLIELSLLVGIECTVESERESMVVKSTRECMLSVMSVWWSSKEMSRIVRKVKRLTCGACWFFKGSLYIRERNPSPGIAIHPWQFVKVKLQNRTFSSWVPGLRVAGVVAPSSRPGLLCSVGRTRGSS